MSYEAGIRADLRGRPHHYAGLAEARPAGFRQPADVIGRAYEPGSAGLASGSAGSRGVFAVLGAALQLVLPVALLLALSLTAFLYGDNPVSWFGTDTAQWLTLGHLVLPLTFFAIALTNRRYGAGYAMAQTVLAWLILAGFAVLGGDQVREMTGRALPALGPALGFGGALFVGQAVSVLVFDRTRGPRWWTAPFWALLWGGLVFCLIAFPALYLGTTVDWFGRLVVVAGIMAGAALALLIPYWLLRRMVPPLSGFGGY